MTDPGNGAWKIKRNGISIGFDHPIVAAPMAGGVDTPYRMVLHNLGCQLSFTEMVSARALFEGAERTRKFYKWIPERGYSGAQIFGTDPEYLSFAAREMEITGHHLIDLNVGCPKRKVTRTGAGSAMLKDPENLLKCVCSITDATKVPVGVKMRMGYHHLEEAGLKIIVKDMEGAGISWIAIHPRTAFQQYSGTADRNLVSKMSDWIDLPLIASGDVRSPDDIIDYLERGATAVMVARGHLGDPTWINRASDNLRGKEWIERYPQTAEQVILHIGHLREHLNNSVEWYGEERGCIEFRPHFSWYLKRFKGRREYRDRMYSIKTRSGALAMIDEIEEDWSGQETMTKF
jgi:tRNA-dihydrouridine synthase B